MTSRTDIAPTISGWRRLSYTRRCGWVDWGHALPFAAGRLIMRIAQQADPRIPLPRGRLQLEGGSAFAVRYGLTSGALGYKVERDQDYVVRRDMPTSARWSAALGIFMAASIGLERYQGSFPIGLISSSSFSAEDLVSNLIGFYAAAQRIPLVRMRVICGEVSVDESYRIWDTHLPGGLGKLKNRKFQPRLFPTKEGVRSPIDLTFPRELTRIRPSSLGGDWVVVEQRFLPERLIASRAVINVLRSGHVDVARPGTIANPSAPKPLSTQRARP